MVDGFPPGFDITVAYGILAPAGPPPVIAKLNAQIAGILKSQAIIDRFTAIGLEAKGGSPQQFGKVIRDEVTQWAKVIEEAKIRLN